MLQYAKTNRRAVLKTSAAMIAATSIPAWFDEECRAQQASQNTAADASKPAVALVGCGGRGRTIAREANAFARVVALCDVDERQLAAAKSLWPDAETYDDFRKVMERRDIEAVICGTVDHWHALVSIAAMRSGKDVYCEKPLTMTIDEGKHLVAVAKETNRILQTGSQQKSDARFRLACELVRNGRLGSLKRVDVYLPSGRREGPFVSTDVPAGFNWDKWQGQTPSVPYIKERTHTTFRYWWEYSGGTMTDWGAHHNDIALWGMGLERSGPTRIDGKSLVEMIPGGFTAASEYDVEYSYENGVIHRCQSTKANAWDGAVIDPAGQHHGVRFAGADGWIWVTRGAISASNPDWLTQPLSSSATRLYESANHMQNFFDCVKSRKATICDTEIGHRSASICHLGVISIRLGRVLQWDPLAESVIGDPEANQMLVRSMRSPWNYDL